MGSVRIQGIYGKLREGKALRLQRELFQCIRRLVGQFLVEFQPFRKDNQVSRLNHDIKFL